MYKIFMKYFSIFVVTLLLYLDNWFLILTTKYKVSLNDLLISG